MNERVEYIFSINTGRSGSDYLARIFKHVADCRSCHEPLPIGNGKAMRLFSLGRSAAMRTLTERKVEVIAEMKRDCRLYFESNHCFIKGFGWLIPHHIPQEKIGVVILKRDKAKIAASLFRIGASPLNPAGRRWLIPLDLRNPLVSPPTTPLAYQCARVVKFMYRSASFVTRQLSARQLPYPQRLKSFELKCLEWYVDETYARAEAFKKKFPRIQYYEVSIDELNSVESVRRMLAFFDCSAETPLSDVVGEATNLKPERS